ncbi:MAG: hypothetical protein EPN22_13385 [Nitrospirae bacterium]|nr:MAG: hypothetical protein EPN22_13385 [Nitrospirota bacterium]
MSIGRHSIYNLLGSVLPMAVTFITLPMYIGYIGAERYGVIAVIWGLLSYFAFFDLGLGRAVAQRMSLFSDAEPFERSNLLWTALISTFILGVFAGVIFWLFSEYILINIIKMSSDSRLEAAEAVVWLLLALPIILPVSILQGALQARLKFAEINIIVFVGTLISQLLPLSLAYAGYVELRVLVPAALSSRIFMAALLFRQCFRHIPLFARPELDRSHLKGLLQYGGWVSVMTLLEPVIGNTDRLIIATLNGAKAVTSYTIPFDLAMKTWLITSSLSAAIFPRLASLSHTESKDLAMRATMTLIAVMTPVAVIGTFVVQHFLNFWLGKSLAANSAGVAEIIMLSLWINSLGVLFNARLMAIGNLRALVIIYIFVIPVYLCVAWLCIGAWGIVGAAAAWTMCGLIQTCAVLYLNGTLFEILRLAAPSFVLVVIGTAALLIGGLNVFAYWSLGFILLCLSLYKDRAQLPYAVKAFARQNKELEVSA